MESELLRNIVLYAHIAGDLCLIAQSIRLERHIKYFNNLYEIGEDLEPPSPLEKRFIKQLFLYGYIPFQTVALGAATLYLLRILKIMP